MEAGETPLPPKSPERDLNCEICRDMGVVRREVAVGEPGFGQAHPCPGCWERRRTAMLERNRRALPEPMRAWSFDNMAPHPRLEGDKQQKYQRLCSFVKNWNEEIYKELPWLALMGSVGWGKTRLAVQCITQRIDQPEIGAQGLLIRVPDLLAELRMGIKDETMERRLLAYQETPFLVLDDLGAEYHKGGSDYRDRGVDWVDESLYRILDTRYVYRRLTILTSNVGMKQLDERLADRLQDTQVCAFITANFPSFRRGRPSTPV